MKKKKQRYPHQKTKIYETNKKPKNIKRIGHTYQSKKTQATNHYYTQGRNENKIKKKKDFTALVAFACLHYLHCLPQILLLLDIAGIH